MKRLILPLSATALCRNSGPAKAQETRFFKAASRRREDLLEVSDRINPTIAELKQAIEEAAEKWTVPGSAELSASSSLSASGVQNS